jgi:hypothetical protein
VTWFKRAGLLPAWVNYEQDIELLTKNFESDMQRFLEDPGSSSPPGSFGRLQEFLLWQLPQYSSFEEEELLARQVLPEVIKLTSGRNLEEVLSMLDPVGKCSLMQLRTHGRQSKLQSQRRDRHPGVAR